MYQLPLAVDSEKVAEALNKKKATAICVSCGNNDWALLPQAALVTQWVNTIPAPGIPVSAAICNNCGFIRLHALNALGLLPQEGLEGV